MKLNLKMFEPGSKVFFSTVTMYYTGVVVEVNDDSVLLTKAAWIPDTGRLGEFLNNPVKTAQEVEAFPTGLTMQINSDHINMAVLLTEIPDKTK